MSSKEIVPDQAESGDLIKRKKVLSHAIEARLRSAMKDAKKDNEDLSKEEMAKEGLRGIIKRLRDVMPNKDQEISDIADALLVFAGEDKDLFIEKVCSDISDFILKNFTLQEIEQIARRYATYESFVLNRLVTYGITDNLIHIHSPLTFIDNPIELRTLFLDALRKLADKLKNDPRLASIEKVTASSWIVAKAQRSFKDAGFTITHLDKENQLGEAEISKEKLLEMYGE